VVEIPPVTWHRWELPQLAMLVAIGNQQLYKSIICFVVLSHLSTSSIEAPPELLYLTSRTAIELS
jgi:hypothetical protein